MTAPIDLCAFSATELRDGYAAGTFTPIEVMIAIEARIDRDNAAVNAIIAENRKASHAAAAASTARWQVGEQLSALDGVPISVKDNIHVAGLPATWGSRIHVGDDPPVDEAPIERLRAAGAILFAKTNVPEFTLQGYTGNPVFGVSRNPLALDRTPGGSTGGGAAAVASGMGPIAIGTDGGGSLRRPAAHCGLFGFKPSIGMVARNGGFPQILSDFEVLGPLARTPEDLRAVFDVLSGPDSRDVRTLATYAPARAFPARPLIGYFTSVDDAPVDPRIVDAAEAFATELMAAGCEVERIAAPYVMADIHSVWGVIAQAGIAWHLKTRGNPLAQVGENARTMAQAGQALAATDYVGAIDACGAIRAKAAQLFNTYDMLVCPSIAALAWPAGEAYPTLIDGREAGPRGHALFTGWMNVSGLAAASVPVGITPDAGGIGMQLVAPAGRDGDLLDFVIHLGAVARRVPHQPARTGS